VDVFHDPGLQRSGAGNRCVEVVDLEPDDDAVAVAPAVGVDQVGVVLGVPRARRFRYLRRIS
jgi:hypothetical protein